MTDKLAEQACVRAMEGLSISRARSTILGLWATHDVRIHATGIKRFHHPVAGDLFLQFETLDLPGDQGQTLYTFAAEPGSASENALAFLASWAASPSETAATGDPAGGPTIPDRSRVRPDTSNTEKKTEQSHE